MVHEQMELGNNYHMTEIGAAMGVVQLCLDNFVKRETLANLYKKNLVPLPLKFQKVSEKIFLVTIYSQSN